MDNILSKICEAALYIDSLNMARVVLGELCSYIANLKAELADARSDIHDLQTRLSELETE